MLDRIFSEAKLRKDDFPGGDGYYVRTHDGKRIGPMTGERAASAQSVRSLHALLPSPSAEREFNIVRTTNDVQRVASAWREAGGSVFKVQLKAQVKWDFNHALSCAACNHCFELVIIIFCFFCTVLAFMLLNTKQVGRPRAARPLVPLLISTTLPARTRDCRATAVATVADEEGARTGRAGPGVLFRLPVLHDDRRRHRDGTQVDAEVAPRQQRSLRE